MAGVMLVCMGVTRLGKLIHFVPYPVTTGFTAGIAVTIATIALNDFFGLGIENLTGHFPEKAAAIIGRLSSMKTHETLVGVATLVTIFALPKIAPKIPGPVAGIAVGTLLSWLFAKNGTPVETLFSRFSYATPAGEVLRGIPPYPPVLHLPGGDDSLFRIPDYQEFMTLLLPAFVIASLAALESLLSATVADSIARTKHDPDAELSGIGIANIFFRPCGRRSRDGRVGAHRREHPRRRENAGGRHYPCRAAAVLYGHAVGLYQPYTDGGIGGVADICRMAHWPQFIRIVHLAPRSDIFVLVTCFLLTVLIDMVAGVTIGMVMASLLFMARVADTTHLHISHPGKPDIAHGKLPKGVMIYRVEGPLFFGSIDKMLEGADAIEDDIKKLVIDLMHVPMIDMTGMMGMKTFLLTVAQADREVTICGHKDVTSRIRRKIADMPFARHVHMMNSVEAALKA